MTTKDMTKEKIAKLREWIRERCCDCRAAHQTKFSCQSTACWKTRDEILALLGVKRKRVAGKLQLPEISE